MTFAEGHIAAGGAGEPGQQPAISLRDVRKQYGTGSFAVDGITLDIHRGELVCFVGPSGCGKTTTLKMINRLIEPTSGTILVDGTNVTLQRRVDLRRSIGYVIQQIGLFPHESVRANVSAVPRLLGWSRHKQRERADEMLRLVGLDPDRFGSRYPGELSGGQQQRVGVARALAADPPVLLMDEPFSALDPIARGKLQKEFIRIQCDLHKTIVMVTHDIDEAILMADRIAIFRDAAKLEQYDSPAAILSNPATSFVREFVGTERSAQSLGRATLGPDDLGRPLEVVVSGGLERASGADRHAGEDPVPSTVDLDEVVMALGADGRVVGWSTRDHVGGTGDLRGRIRPLESTVPIGSTLSDAMSRILDGDCPLLAVVQPDTQRYIGVLTLPLLHAAFRRSVAALRQPGRGSDDAVAHSYAKDVTVVGRQ